MKLSRKRPRRESNWISWGTRVLSNPLEARWGAWRTQKAIRRGEGGSLEIPHTAGARRKQSIGDQEEKCLPPAVYLQRPLLAKHSIVTVGKGEECKIQLQYHKAKKAGLGDIKQSTDKWNIHSHCGGRYTHTPHYTTHIKIVQNTHGCPSRKLWQSTSFLQFIISSVYTELPSAWNHQGKHSTPRWSPAVPQGPAFAVLFPSFLRSSIRAALESHEYHEDWKKSPACS